MTICVSFNKQIHFRKFLGLKEVSLGSEATKATNNTIKNLLYN